MPVSLAVSKRVTQSQKFPLAVPPMSSALGDTGGGHVPITVTQWMDYGRLLKGHRQLFKEMVFARDGINIDFHGIFNKKLDDEHNKLPCAYRICF